MSTAKFIEVHVGDVVRLRKPHACGGLDWTIVRLGADIGLRCDQCEHRILLSRSVFERRLKAFLSHAVMPMVDLPSSSAATPRPSPADPSAPLSVESARLNDPSASLAAAASPTDPDTSVTPDASESPTDPDASVAATSTPTDPVASGATSEVSPSHPAVSLPEHSVSVTTPSVTPDASESTTDPVSNPGVRPTDRSPSGDTGASGASS